MKKTHQINISDFLTIGVVSTLLLVCLTILLEHSSLGHRYEVMAYEVLHQQLAPLDRLETLPVVVVDISKVPGGKDNPTSSKTIGDIVASITAEHPRAIGIDIDFAPDGGAWRDDGDPDFFNRCIALKEEGTPVFLGVYKTIAEGPDRWLGVKRYAELAAAISVRGDNTLYVPHWLGADGQRLRMLSYQLAEAYFRPKPIPGPPRTIGWALRTEDELQSIDLPSGKVTYTSTLVNYSKLEELQREAVRSISPQSVKEAGDLFANRIVILGDASNDLASDKFFVPGRERLVPGVFLHACTVNTLVREPLYEFKYPIRLAIDGLLALVILTIVAIVRKYKEKAENFDWHKLHVRCCSVAAILVIIAGLLLVRGTPIIWLDFIIVAIAVFVHPQVDEAISPHIQKSNKWVISKWRRIFSRPQENAEIPDDGGAAG